MSASVHKNPPDVDFGYFPCLLQEDHIKKGRLSAYNLVVSKKNMQVDFTLYEAGRQLKLPMETEIFIAADDPVRLVSAVVERLTIKSQAPK